MRYFLLNKPRGCITSTVDDTGRGRPTVYEVAEAAGVPSFGPVGRLDFDTSGVMVFTDDFKLKKAISSPYYKGKAKVGTVPSMEKVYHALIAGTIAPDDKGVHQLREPLHFNRKLDGPGGAWTKPAEARVLLTTSYKLGEPVPWKFKPGTTPTITWIEVVLREGKNRQIRRLCRRSDFELTRLHRVSVGPIVLGDLEEGCCRELTRREVEALYKRCLPEDPLCPTVAEAESTLSRRLEETVHRQHEEVPEVGIACLSPHKKSREDDGRDGAGVSMASTGAKVVAAGAAGGSDGSQAHVPSGQGRGTVGGVAGAGDVQGIVCCIIGFAIRSLHETPAGQAGESGGPEFCPGEEKSLAQARAVPPNISHMTCGYRPSQVEMPA